MLKFLIHLEFPLLYEMNNQYFFFQVPTKLSQCYLLDIRSLSADLKNHFYI